MWRREQAAVASQRCYCIANKAVDGESKIHQAVAWLKAGRVTALARYVIASLSRLRSRRPPRQAQLYLCINQVRVATLVVETDDRSCLRKLCCNDG